MPWGRTADAAKCRSWASDDTKTSSWWFVHLTEDKAGLFKNAGFFHFVVKVISFTSTFTNTSKDRVTAVEFCDVVNKLGNEDSLTNTGTGEEPGFTTLNKWGDKVNNLDSCFQDFGFVCLLIKRRGFAVNRCSLCIYDCRLAVNYITNNVKHTSLRLVANGNANRGTGCYDFIAATKAVGT